MLRKAEGGRICSASPGQLSADSGLGAGFGLLFSPLQPFRRGCPVTFGSFAVIFLSPKLVPGCCAWHLRRFEEKENTLTPSSEGEDKSSTTKGVQINRLRVSGREASTADTAKESLKEVTSRAQPTEGGVGPGGWSPGQGRIRDNRLSQPSPARTARPVPCMELQH